MMIALSLSVEERMLVHLLGYEKQWSEDMLPSHFSYQGIASAINVKEENVSKNIRKMEKDGLVTVFTNKYFIEGGKKNAVRLTEGGRKRVKNILKYRKKWKFMFEGKKTSILEIYEQIIAKERGLSKQDFENHIVDCAKFLTENGILTQIKKVEEKGDILTAKGSELEEANLERECERKKTQVDVSKLKVIEKYYGPVFRTQNIEKISEITQKKEQYIRGDYVVGNKVVITGKNDIKVRDKAKKNRSQNIVDNINGEENKEQNNDK